MDKTVVPDQIRKVFEGRVFSVVVESISTRKGRKMEVEIVRHPGSVVIIPVRDDGDIILVRQYRRAIDRWTWELPAGSQEPGEDTRQAAIRECHEEIGKIAGVIVPIGTLYPTPGYSDELMNFFRAEQLRDPRDDESAARDEDEDLEIRAFSRAEIAAMIANAEIIDMKTVSGLLLLANAESQRRV